MEPGEEEWNIPSPGKKQVAIVFLEGGWGGGLWTVVSGSAEICQECFIEKEFQFLSSYFFHYISLKNFFI